MDKKERARRLLRSWRGDTYSFGTGNLKDAAQFARTFGTKAMLVSNTAYLEPVYSAVITDLKAAGVTLVPDYVVAEARPNAPREDVYRLESYILHFKPDCVITVGGGSAIDGIKAAIMLATLGTSSPEIETYFGTGIATESLAKLGKKMLPHIAVMTAASSGAHLTKYSNVTDPVSGQKKLVVDEAVIPTRAVFDYSVTQSMPVSLSIDGALDAIAHTLEVFYGIPADKYQLAAEIAETAIGLVVEYAPKVIANPSDLDAREALGLATDLGGYAIMIGGTNGAHLTSFSLVDVTSHGRACGVMNPYYAVFFAPAVEKQLKTVGAIFHKAGFMKVDPETLSGRALGERVAEAMIAFNRSIGAEAKLTDFPKFTEGHITKAIAAAKNPQLEMKLKNMPVPLSASQIDEYMAPILRAAASGDFSGIKMLAATGK